MAERKGNFKGRKKGARDKKKRKRRLGVQAFRLGAGITAGTGSALLIKKLQGGKLGGLGAAGSAMWGLTGYNLARKATRNEEEKQRDKEFFIKVNKPTAKYKDANQEGIKQAIGAGSLIAGVTTLGLAGLALGRQSKKTPRLISKLQANPRLGSKYVSKVLKKTGRIGLAAGIVGGVGLGLKARKDAEEWNKTFDKKSQLSPDEKKRVGIQSVVAAGLGVAATTIGVKALLKNKVMRIGLDDLYDVLEEKGRQQADVRYRAIKNDAIAETKEAIQKIRSSKTAADLEYRGLPNKSATGITKYDPEIRYLTAEEKLRKAQKIAEDKGRRAGTKIKLEENARSKINNTLAYTVPKKALQGLLVGAGASTGIGTYNLGRSINRRIKKSRESKDKK